MPTYHFLTVEQSGETVNLVVEISEEKLRALAGQSPDQKEKSQYRLAYEIACAVLRKGSEVRINTQIYNREITRANFEADYGPEMVTPDGCKGWMVKSPKAAG